MPAVMKTQMSQHRKASQASRLALLQTSPGGAAAAWTSCTPMAGVQGVPPAPQTVLGLLAPLDLPLPPVLDLMMPPKYRFRESLAQVACRKRMGSLLMAESLNAWLHILKLLETDVKVGMGAWTNAHEYCTVLWLLPLEGWVGSWLVVCRRRSSN